MAQDRIPSPPESFACKRRTPLLCLCVPRPRDAYQLGFVFHPTSVPIKQLLSCLLSLFLSTEKTQPVTPREGNDHGARSFLSLADASAS
jgi:hypothetical protein